AAISGNIIPKWKGGAGVTYRWNDPFQSSLDASALKFAGINVYQAVPGLSWRWTSEWRTDFRLYLSDNEFRGGGSRIALNYNLSTQWNYSANSGLRFTGSLGDEDGEDLTRNLIGTPGYWSAGIAWRIGSDNGWSFEP